MAERIAPTEIAYPNVLYLCADFREGRKLETHGRDQLYIYMQEFPHMERHVAWCFLKINVGSFCVDL
jgi:hypothetical protein